ncbi:protein PET100 homolog, mitochondrial isoform X1 [Podarcis muralis]|uniref:protein PET100 homolog, mitochondrial isoform X1 n=1 Tax=Podarcis muralis TaxID=64176 RepID=UPI00109FD5E0|nr:protein PET100 homolog, mitochondrial isoform X1 [Podarcis muralis]
MGVKLEVFRVCGARGPPGMMLYLSFPVAMFWISNQAEYFEEYVIKRKREIYPPEDNYQRKELEDFKERMRKEHEKRMLQSAKE